MKSRCSRTTRETEATYHALFTNIQADRLTLLAVLLHPTSFPHISFTLAFHSAIPTPPLSLPPHTSSFTCPSTRHPSPFISSTLPFHSVISTLPLSRTPTHFIFHATPVSLHPTTSILSPIHPPPYRYSIHFRPPLLTKQKSPVCLSTDRTGSQSVIRTIILR